VFSAAADIGTGLSYIYDMNVASILNNSSLLASHFTSGISSRFYPSRTSFWFFCRDSNCFIFSCCSFIFSL